MKWESNLTSGVKYFVSSTVSLLRGAPLSQVKSPYANGVTLSTPSGPGSGAERASGISRAGFAGAAGAGCGEGNRGSGAATALSNAAAGGFFNDAVVVGG